MLEHYAVGHAGNVCPEARVLALGWWCPAVARGSWDQCQCGTGCLLFCTTCAESSGMVHFLILWFLKLNVHLPYNSRTVLLGIYPLYMKMYVYIKTGFYMYSYKQIAALFIEVPNWKQLRYPSICGKKVKL